jgi:HTH-type transcriptional regulator, sugar sensing transcriptional regulator
LTSYVPYGILWLYKAKKCNNQKLVKKNVFKQKKTCGKVSFFSLISQNMSLLDNLLTFGFSPSEAKTYLSLLEQGELSVGEISTRAELSRAGTHEALNAILSRGLVEVRREGRNTYYKSAHPNVLFGMLEEKKREEERKQNEMTDTIRGLIGMFQVSESKPGVRFFEGVEGLQALYLETLKENTNIDAILSPTTPPETLKHWLNDVYTKKRVELDIPARVIVSTRVTDEYIQNSTTALRDVRIVPEDQYPIQIEINIFGNNRVAFISYSTKELFGVLIDSPAISVSMKSFFALAWIGSHNN